LRYAIENYPEKWAEYQAALPKYAAQAGIDPTDYAGMKNPVLYANLTRNTTWLRLQPTQISRQRQ
jgi:hypothetical protein